jgi:hypothetical protein
MSDETSAPAGGEAIAVITPASDAPESFSLSQAAEALTAAREPKKKEPAAESADPATADPELAQANADPVEQQPISEDTNEAEPEALPPIDPPRSWTQAEKERFQSLPRETQEYLHTREQEREREFRRSQNEIADQRKAIETERTKAEEVRKQYEAQLPALMQELQNAQQSAFSDIRTVDDVTKLANEDPFRYLQWQAHQTKLQAVNAELERSKGEKSKAEQSAWQSHVQKENELAAEYIPELADKTKGPALTARAADRLSELGFKPEELARLASGQEKLSLYDHRIQRLIFSDLKLSDIQSAKTAVAAKPLPPVQRPGTAKPQGSAQSERTKPSPNPQQDRIAEGRAGIACAAKPAPA